MMKQIKTNKMMKRLAIMVVLLAGLVLTGTSLTNAQTCIKNNDTTKTLDEKESIENIDCWLNKVQSGVKDLSGAYLKEVDLSNENLSNANLSNANFSGTNLSGANLSKANLSGTNFILSVLTNANMEGTRLTGADLRGATLTNATVSRRTTKGVDFADWKERGGKVVE